VLATLLRPSGRAYSNRNVKSTTPHCHAGDDGRPADSTNLIAIDASVDTHHRSSCPSTRPPALLWSPPVRVEQAEHAAAADPATTGHRDPAQRAAESPPPGVVTAADCSAAQPGRTSFAPRRAPSTRIAPGKRDAQLDLLLEMTAKPLTRWHWSREARCEPRRGRSGGPAACAAQEQISAAAKAPPWCSAIVRVNTMVMPLPGQRWPAWACAGACS
jgi:hypothetical protein